MKKLNILLLVVVMSFVMVGCGGGSSSDSTPVEPVVDNSGNLENDHGYFGDSVIFGNQKVTGYWTMKQESTGNRIALNIYSDGDISIQKHTDFTYGDYGVSQDGKELTYIADGDMFATYIKILEIHPTTMTHPDGTVENIACYDVEYREAGIVADDISMCPF